MVYSSKTWGLIGSRPSWVHALAVLEKFVGGPVLLVAVVALQGVVVHLGGQLVQVDLQWKLTWSLVGCINLKGLFTDFTDSGDPDPDPV